MSLAPTRVKILSTMPMTARFAGTWLPICASSTISPTCRRKLDFPLMFGPVMIRIWSLPVSSRTEFGVYCSPGRQQPFDHRMPAVLDLQQGSVVHFRTDVLIFRGHGGKGHEAIQCGQGLGIGLDRLGLCRDTEPDLRKRCRSPARESALRHEGSSPRIPSGRA